MEKILGLDLGTNSIGWALIEQDFEKKTGNILGMGSRIIPMDEKILGEFGRGNSVSQTAKRTSYRSARRRYERNHLRRERLHRVLNVLGFLPSHYASDIDFEKRLGKFKDETETKLVWKKNGKKDNGKDKFEFAFQSTFNEMLEEFKKSQPDMLDKKNRKGEDFKIPYDWTIYYLRKKALKNAISKEELAWLILNFNQKRGYYQLRGEEEEINENKKEFVVQLKVVKVEKGEVDKRNDKKTWYTITFDNGWEHPFPFTSEPNWLNTEREFLVIEEYDDEGKIKIVKDKKKDTKGREKRMVSTLPSFEEIDLMSKKDQDKIYKKIKARTELTIENSGKTVGTYIYENLLQNPTQKIRGKLVRTIERKFYKDELKQILEKQIELQSGLFTDDLYYACIRELYKNNEAHQQQLQSKNDFVHLFLNDIIFYQRPLKSQKSSIGNCSLEFRLHKINKKDVKGNPIKTVFEKDDKGKDIEIKEYLKAIPKSNPYYQEFRVWQWLYNLKIYTKKEDKDVTIQFLKSTEDWENLFEFLMCRKEVNHKDLLKYFFKDLKGKTQSSEIAKYRWNYVYDSEKDESKTYPMNETRYEIRKRLKEVKNILDIFLTRDIEQQLWHIIYSVTDKNEFETALETFAKKHSLYYVLKSERDNKNPDKTCFVYNFRNLVWKDKTYGSFSEKAIKKLLPLMRLGKYWKWENIDTKIQERIDKLLTGEFDEEIQNRVREKAINLTDRNHFQGLQLWLASYVVYDRHSEVGNIEKWNSVEDLKTYLKEFKQHSLRNPIVEQVITETLRVVHDIWKKYGNGAKDFFDEIHIELGREMKNTADERKRLTNIVTDNENTNQRIKLLLMELKNDNKIENVREFSPSQQEILKIYEDGVLNSVKNKEYKENEKTQKEEDEAMLKIGISSQPTKSELTRYKLWLEQKYRSPYTGEAIPLSKLFTPAYEIEHIIPQSRYFDNSLSNKVICEAEVNKLKDNQLGLEFIKNHPGEKIQIGEKHVSIFTEGNYKKFIEEQYSKNKSKRNKLLLEEIPDKMITRQLNDTRYISKFVSQILSNIVREEKEDEGINSKNIVPGNGQITTRLKQDWGLNNVWNELILPRFERMNKLTNTEMFTTKNKEGHVIPTVPFELSKGFQKKRIDHRHHAMDALVIACATLDHVNLLNNQSAKTDNSRFDLQNKLRNKEKWKDNNGKEHDKFTEFKKPWQNFTIDAKNELEKTVVSFKQNLRVINKTKFDGLTYKESKEKSKDRNWAIRKPMHKEFVYAKVDLKWRKTANGKITTAIRKSLDTSFDLNKIESSVTDTGIQKILKNHLKKYQGRKDNNGKDIAPETLAFTPEGIEDMNTNIVSLNDESFHQPIYKVRVFEEGTGRFALGQKGNKKDKYVEAAKGSNLFFAVYQNKNGKRSFETIPLNIVIERQKQGLNSVPDKNENGEGLCSECSFLSPNDLVYVPTIDELANNSKIDFGNLTSEQKKRIYKMVSSTGSECHFIHSNIASLVKNYDSKSKIGELGSLNKLETTVDNALRIKECCIKLNVDRLGNISKTIS